MLFRRFSKHFSEQNWFAVGLDVIVVIVGIFLGMQVTELYQNSKDRAAESEYLERIRVDVENDLETFIVSKQLTNDRINQINLIHKVILNPNLAVKRPSDFVSALERGTWRSTLPVKARAWEELLSSGRTLLIEDTDIRNGLFDYYRSIDRWDVFLDDFQARKKFTEATAGLLSAGHLTVIEETTENDKPFEDFISVSPDEAKDIATKLSKNEEANRWLPKMIQYHVVVRISIEDKIKQSEALLKRISQKISEDID